MASHNKTYLLGKNPVQNTSIYLAAIHMCNATYDWDKKGKPAEEDLFCSRAKSLHGKSLDDGSSDCTVTFDQYINKSDKMSFVSRHS